MPVQLLTRSELQDSEFLELLLSPEGLGNRLGSMVIAHSLLAHLRGRPERVWAERTAFRHQAKLRQVRDRWRAR